MNSAIFSINNEDVKWCFPEEDHYLVPEITQETLDEIADRAKELMEEQLSDWFWNVFDDCLQEAVNEKVTLKED